jgi:hypothetical protein
MPRQAFCTFCVERYLICLVCGRSFQLRHSETNVGDADLRFLKNVCLSFQSAKSGQYIAAQASHPFPACSQPAGTVPYVHWWNVRFGEVRRRVYAGVGGCDGSGVDCRHQLPG